MWFERMTLEVWFDDYQYDIEYDVGESAVKYVTVSDLGVDLNAVELRYGHHTGRPDLREVIAEQYEGLSSEHIVVTNGASEAIFTVIASIVKPGDHVIVEHPNYPSLYDIPQGLGCEVSFLPLTFENEYEPKLDALKEMATAKTKFVALTHPNNPTGSMISEEDLQDLIDWVEEKDIYLIFDETYREMGFEHILPPAASLSPKAISITSMSKCFGLPGIRTGWLATKDAFVLDGVLAARELTTITNNALSEEIALHVLKEKDVYLEKAEAHIAANREIVAEWMKDNKDIEWVYPKAGVVSFPRFRSNVKVDPEKVYRRLAEEYKTFVIPGRCFGVDNSYFRLGFGARPEEIRVGLDNVNRALNDLRK